MEKRGNLGSSDLHCAPRAKFLTAEASNTITSIDNRLALLHYDSLGGTDLGAHSAPYTEILIEDGASLQNRACNLAE